MVSPPEDEPLVLASWPTGMRRLIAQGQLRTWGDLASYSEPRLLQSKGIGRTLLKVIKRRLADRGLSLSEPSRFGTYVTSITPVAPICGVYAIRCQEFIKIGCAKDVANRIAGLATGYPFELDVIAVIPTESASLARAMEKSLHGEFKATRHRGEWFRDTPELRARISDLASGTTSGSIQ
jgi:hypothetical protein